MSILVQRLNKFASILLCHPVVERDPSLIFLDSGLRRKDRRDGLLHYTRNDPTGENIEF